MTKFEELLHDSGQKTAEKVSFFIVLMIPALIYMLSRRYPTVKTSIIFLLLFWFHWLNLKGASLQQKIKKLDRAIDDLKDLKISPPRKTWKHYIKINRMILLWAFLISILLIRLYKNLSDGEAMFVVLFITIMAFSLSRLISIFKFMSELINIYIGGELQSNKLAKPPHLPLLFMQGFSVGMLYVVVIYNLFKMSMPAFHYVLHYLAFSSLTALSISLMAIYRYFNSAVKCIDAIRLEQ